MIAFLVLSLVANVAIGMPSVIVVPKNTITVPPNCAPGQEWVNGACRDVWYRAVTNLLHNLKLAVHNTVSTPTNCQPPQEWFNGACRDVWRSDVTTQARRHADVQNVVTVPPNCPEGQEFVNGACRDIWRIYAAEAVNMMNERPVDGAHKNVISVPNQCPIGYKPDALGYCREIFPLTLLP